MTVKLKVEMRVAAKVYLKALVMDDSLGLTLEGEKEGESAAYLVDNSVAQLDLCLADCLADLSGDLTVWS